LSKSNSYSRSFDVAIFLASGWDSRNTKQNRNCIRYQRWHGDKGPVLFYCPV